MISLHSMMDFEFLESNFRWLEEITAIGIIIACVFVTLIVQRTVQGVVYNMSMYKSNMQHFANTHWVAEYSKAKTQSPL